MNKFLLILSLIAFSCTDHTEKSHDGNKHEHESSSDTSHSPALTLDKGAKWKADEATKNNVSQLVWVLDDSSNIGFRDRDKLTGELQSGIDTLVQQCTMKGPEHDVLHAWLEQVINDLKELKRSDEDRYGVTRSRLRKHVVSFYDYFS